MAECYLCKKHLSFLEGYLDGKRYCESCWNNKKDKIRELKRRLKKESQGYKKLEMLREPIKLKKIGFFDKLLGTEFCSRCGEALGSMSYREGKKLFCPSCYTEKAKREQDNEIKRKNKIINDQLTNGINSLSQVNVVLNDKTIYQIDYPWILHIIETKRNNKVILSGIFRPKPTLNTISESHLKINIQKNKNKSELIDAHYYIETDINVSKKIHSVCKPYCKTFRGDWRNLDVTIGNLIAHSVIIDILESIIHEDIVLRINLFLENGTVRTEVTRSA